MALAEGQSLGPYRVLAQLGQGGMATVYKGYHPRLDRYVAIKVVHQAFLEDPAFVSRFEREAQIVASLDHPHIVPVYDFSEVNGQPYLVMKYIEGQTLKALLQTKPLSLDTIVHVMSEIADALDYAHRHGVLHRDIKPSNIVMDAHGAAYLTDFGLARIAQAGESTMSQDMLLGTPHYISPEQAMGRRDLDARTDLYSLGVVLYELVVGRVPFSADTPYAVIHDHIYRALPLPTAVNPELPASVERVLLKALAKTPADRYATATDMISAFQAAVSTSGMSELNPQRVGSATVVLAQMRDREVSPPPMIPAPTPSIPAPIPQPRAVKPKREVEYRVDFDSIGRQIREAVTNWDDSPWNPTNFNGEEVPVGDEASIRKRVEKQFKKRTEFLTHLAAYVTINLMLWLVYAFGGGFMVSVLGGDGLAEAMNFPFPILVSLGWGAGLAAHAVETYFKTGERAAKQEQAIRQSMRDQYGDDWNHTVSKPDYNKVRTRILKPFNKRIEWYQHLSVYVMINTLLWIVYGLTSGAATMGAMLGDLPQEVLHFPFPIIVMLGWGAGLAAHGVDTLMHTGVRSAAREREVQREIERERSMLGASAEKQKREFPVRLTEDGELTDSVIESWDNKPKREQRG